MWDCSKVLKEKSAGFYRPELGSGGGCQSTAQRGLKQGMEPKELGEHQMISPLRSPPGELGRESSPDMG